MIMSVTVSDRQRYSTSLVALYALFLILVLGGCGYKNMPVPPQEIVPVAISDLRYELDAKGVTLTWTYPAKTVKGDALTDLTEFQLYRAVVPADKYCDTCPVPFGEAVRIPGGAVAANTPRNATYSATLLRPGHLFFFKVRSRAGWWAESADSNIVSFMWNIPPAAPEGLTAEAGDGSVTLAWSPVTTHMDSTAIKEPVKYQVHRSLGGGPFVNLGDLQDMTGFTDSDVVNGREYQYKIQAVTMYPKGQVSGGVSASVAAVPVDMTASAAPTGVQGIRTVDGVKIIWEPVQGSDVTGYRVYRRVQGAAKAVLIGEVKVPTTIFDDNVPPDAPGWLYSVSSIDNARPANESPASSEIEVVR